LFINNPKENLVVSTGFAVLTPVNIPPSFLYLYTTTELFVDYLVSNADGSAYPAVLPERFAEAEFLIPPEDKLGQFESIVSPMLAQIAHNEEESRTLANLRDSLLPKLMSGELSLADVDAK
jgi:type I restriction enzyme S subunit